MRIHGALLTAMVVLSPLLEGALARKAWDQLEAASVLQWPGDCNPSECVDFEMDETIQETALLADSASKAIDILLGRKTNKVVPKTRTNKRLLEAAKYMFNVDFGDAPDDPKKSWAVAQDKRFVLSAVQENYDNIRKLVYGVGGYTKPKMLCGDGDVEFVTTMGQIGGQPENEPIWRAQKEDKKTTPGWWISNWYSPRGKNGKPIEDLVVRLMTSEKICSGATDGFGPTIGETFYFERVMVLCDRFFSYAPLPRLIEDQKRLAVGSLIDKTQKTRGGYFLHEALHWLDRDMKDQDIDIGQGMQPAYGWERSAALAKKGGSVKEARFNPDNYHWFAVAVVLHKVTWDSNGKKVS